MGAIRTLWARGKQAASLIRLKPFDITTAEGRSKERYRRVALATLASVAARGISILTVLISVPLTLNYLGSERYGLWITISSIITMLAFADLGLGNGLVNAISEANGKDDRSAARAYVSSAFFMLSALAAILVFVFALIYPFVAWERVFNVKSELAIQEAGPAVAMFMLCFVLNMPLGVVQRVQMGYQELFANSLWQALGNLLGLAGVLIAIHVRASLPWLVLAMAGAPALAALLNSLWVFVFQRPWLRPEFARVTRASAKSISRIGLLFFALQISIALGFQSDNIVIAQFLGADQVIQYAVPMKLFALSGTLLSFVLFPLWPAYGEAITRGDISWVRKTFTRSIMLGFGVNLAPAFLLVLFGARISRLWVGPELSPSFLLLLGLGVWTVMNSLNGPIAMLLNGASVIGFQVVCALSMGIVNIISSIFLVQRIGVSGVVYGSVFATILCIYVPFFFYMPLLFANCSKRQTDGNNLAEFADG